MTTDITPAILARFILAVVAQFGTGDRFVRKPVTEIELEAVLLNATQHNGAIVQSAYHLYTEEWSVMGNEAVRTGPVGAWLTRTYAQKAQAIYGLAAELTDPSTLWHGARDIECREAIAKHLGGLVAVLQELVRQDKLPSRYSFVAEALS